MESVNSSKLITQHICMNQDDRVHNPYTRGDDTRESFP